MDSDANSDITVFHTISQFDNSDLETPDEFPNSEPSPSTCSQYPFRLIHSQAQTDSPSTISRISQVTPTYFSFTNECSNNNSPDNTQISYELNNLITLQQHPRTLTIHQLSSAITSSNPPTPTLFSDNTPSLIQSSTSIQSSSTTHRAYRTFKRKFPNHAFPSKPGITRDYINHPGHTKTTEFLQFCLPLFPQYTYSHSDPLTEQPHYVDEHVLFPTLHCASFYHFSNPFCLPLINTPQELERKKKTFSD